MFDKPATIEKVASNNWICHWFSPALTLFALLVLAPFTLWLDRFLVDHVRLDFILLGEAQPEDVNETRHNDVIWKVTYSLDRMTDAA